MSNNELKIKFLDDKPATDDEIKSHKGIAQSIFSIIKNDSKGKAIALKGDWGSGKSTIINLIKKNNGNNSNIKFFEFNIWEHMNDPLKRTFIEKLIDFVLDKDLIKEKRKEFWNERKKNLSGREIKEEVTRESKLTVFTKVLTILTLLIPIGVAMINNASEYNMVFFIGIFIIILPVLHILRKIYKLVRAEHERDENKKLLDKIKNLKDDITISLQNINISDKENKINTYRQTMELPEPTSIEFYFYYNCI